MIFVRIMAAALLLRVGRKCVSVGTDIIREQECRLRPVEILDNGDNL